MRMILLLRVDYFPVSSFVGSDTADDASGLKILQMPFYSIRRDTANNG